MAKPLEEMSKSPEGLHERFGSDLTAILEAAQRQESSSSAHSSEEQPLERDAKKARPDTPPTPKFKFEADPNATRELNIKCQQLEDRCKALEAKLAEKESTISSLRKQNERLKKQLLQKSKPSSQASASSAEENSQEGKEPTMVYDFKRQTRSSTSADQKNLATAASSNGKRKRVAIQE